MGVLNGMRVLLTGGTGSTAPAVIARLLARGAREVRVLSRAPERQRGLAEALGRPGGLRCVAGDLLDAGTIRRAVRGVDAVLHAAACRDVAGAEREPAAAAALNIEGTRRVLEAARAAGAGRVLVYSSDKAVNPTGVMGATKLVAERLAAAAWERHGLRAAAVRFGVVFTSPGSVVRVNAERVRRGQPLALTDPRMTRFGLFAEDVAAGVVGALEALRGGEVFVLRMIPFRVRDLLRAVAAEWAPACGRDPRAVRIEITRPRPGEQFDQAVLTPEEAAVAREGRRWFVVEPPSRRGPRRRPLPASAWRSSAARCASVSQLRRWLRPLVMEGPRSGVPGRAAGERVVRESARLWALERGQRTGNKQGARGWPWRPADSRRGGRSRCS